jgi:hypothetical protein
MERIKLILREIYYEDVNVIKLAHDHVQLRTLLLAMLNHWFILSAN